MEIMKLGSKLVARLSGGLDRFLRRVNEEDQPLATRLACAESLIFEDGFLTISIPSKDTFIVSFIRRRRSLMSTLVRGAWGREASWRIIEIP